MSDTDKPLWAGIYPKADIKLAAAEARLGSTIPELLKGWVDQKIPVAHIVLKLDVGQAIVAKLLDIYGLTEQVAKNRNEAKATRPLGFQEQSRQIRARIKRRGGLK